MKNETPATVATATAQPAIDLDGITVQPFTGRMAEDSNLVYDTLTAFFNVKKAVALFAARQVQAELIRKDNASKKTADVSRATKGSDEKPSMVTTKFKGENKETATWTAQLFRAVKHIAKAEKDYVLIQSAKLVPHIEYHLQDIEKRLLSGEASL